MRIENITAIDGQTITVRHWECEKPLAKVQILHGMAEHCDRYAPFAQYLQQHNIEVIAHNHRGHGERTPIGHYADINGWQLNLNDVASVQQIGNQEAPLFIFGHSMGTFIARDFMATNSAKGLILSGSNQQHPALFHAAKFVAGALSSLQGIRHPSKIMNFLSFGAFNAHFRPNRTEFDWLCRDNEIVDAYIEDPLCGNLHTTKFWQDFMEGMVKVHSQAGLQAVPNIPILLLGGDKDPVGRMGKGFFELEKQLKNTGHGTVELKVYPNARHELLNETNKAEVWQDTLEFILKYTKPS